MMDTPRLVMWDLDARREIMKGIDVLADSVKVTMGPRGRNAVIEQEGAPPILTKDGVTVARAINLRDKWPNLGAQFVKEAAAQTADEAGDGTTTSTVLAQALCSEGLRALEAGHDYSELKSGIERAHTDLQKKIDEMSRPVEGREHIAGVAKISANGEEEIADLIVRAIETVGADGPVAVEEAKGFKSSLEIIDGTEIDRGYLSPYFADDQQKMLCTLERPLVLLVNKTIGSIQEILPVLEGAHREGRALLIVADGLEGEALQMLVLNKMKSALKVCAIASPEFGQGRVNALDDLALLLGTRVWGSADIGDLKNVKLSELGTCEKVQVHRKKSIFIGTQGEEAAKERVRELHEQLEDPGNDSDFKRHIERRIKRLTTGICILRVGGATEMELRERKDRVDDALHATRAAVSGGILPGGGTALVKAASGLKVPKGTASFTAGYNLVLRSCYAPARQIASNAGAVPDLVLNKVRKKKNYRLGYNAKDETYGDLIDAGVIDPTIVVKSSLQNSISVVGNFISVGVAMVADEDETSR